MNTLNDPLNAQGSAASSRILGKNSVLAFIGIALVAISIVAGIGWGITTANSQAVASASPGGISGTSYSNNAISPSASMGKGEVVVTQPRFVRPPAVFDPIEALAVQASVAATTSTAVQPQPTQAGSASATRAVVPTGWQGTGSPLAQMWDLGAQADWAVRPAPLSPRNWRISGVVQRGEQTQAIVLFDGDPAPKFFKIGDTLPGGAKLAWVKPNVIGVVMPKAGVLAVPVFGGQAPDQGPANSQSKKP